MNLIEQAGDYKVQAWSWCAEFCKKNNWNPFDSYFWSKALQEYRRKNNIFEVGDLVTHPMCWGLFRVKEVMKCHILGVTPTGYESKLAIEFIRHATDREIMEGRKL